ncbi:uncharacterized protein PGTG_10183 [Puccinia graminis f. sp. tritici CRL 75-36-700-3]|uniref:UDP-galactose transporter n=2 Tax=Puccinia graminis f. sp. tritici TaxID=56615 RepID=E3KJI8_PUCGT|nr:uncharacterized protein PGTG_10183 [Puccinia graminis f. sp. tritici CRL 75-36-700-3]EFP84463.2 hypothetical protein PGTG_10183 [Puccinia graminis f. sp. tritici CRL 75-36-700-3]
MKTQLSAFLSHPSLSFSLLVLHQSSVALIKRSRTKPGSDSDDSEYSDSGELYNPATAIFLTEALKALISLTILLIQYPSPSLYPCSLFTRLRLLLFHSLGPHHALHILDMFIPAFLYTVQNHLLYISITELEPAIYLLTSQLKILTSALSSVMICERKLVRPQWMCLWTLVLGVMMVQFEPIDQHHHPQQMFTWRAAHHLRGIFALVLSAIASGLAGAWFERSLLLNKQANPQHPTQTLITTKHEQHQDVHEEHPTKDRPTSPSKSNRLAHHILEPSPSRPKEEGPNLWTKNLQLSVPSLLISYLMIYVAPESRKHVREHGFFFGFLGSQYLISPTSAHHSSNAGPSTRIWLVWAIILYHSVGGILVSIIVKQSGHLVKNFATCFSIVLSILASSYSNQTPLGFNFYLGSFLVLVSIKSFTSFESPYHTKIKPN